MRYCYVYVLWISFKVTFLAGMCLQAFVEAFFCLAQKKYKSLPLHEQVASLIDFCEYHLAALDEKRLLCGRGVVERRGAAVTCPTDGLEVTPALHAPLLNRTAAAGKLADCRSHRYPAAISPGAGRDWENWELISGVYKLQDVEKTLEFLFFPTYALQKVPFSNTDPSSQWLLYFFNLSTEPTVQLTWQTAFILKVKTRNKQTVRR